MNSLSYSHTAHYTYLDVALKSRRNPFCALEAEMSAFVPQPLSDYDSYRAAEIERLQKLNPKAPTESLAKWVDKQVSLLASHDHQFYARFDERHMTEYVTVVMLSHALCEALINAILAIGLAHVTSVELFPLLERADFKQKWFFAPKSFAASYVFPRGSALHETLTHLSRQRNALIHYKIELQVNGDKVLEGSDFQRKPYNEETRWMRRFFSLPYDLESFARRAIPNISFMLLSDRKPIETVHAHASA